MKILLTGRNGQLGFELRRALAPLAEVIALDSQACNLASPHAIRHWVREIRPAIIVNAAAYTSVDKAESEPQRAHAINAEGPGALAEEAASLGALIVHYSTDYVFDGGKVEGEYSEIDTPAPLNIYGASKLAGEQAVARANPRHLILRTSWVVGTHGHNFAKTMLRLAAEKRQLDIVSDQWGAPTSAALLADITAHLLRQYSQGAPRNFPYGLYHLTASGETNWHQYASHIIEYARAAGKPIQVAADAIRPIATSGYPTPARRPLNSRLSTRKLQETFNVCLPDWTEGVDHILEQLI
ncbi:dTDP-4-dehydrorhamnose reductase [Halopseudomonas sp. Lyrl_26]|uniref:dTDP-4-dehydrorhamnose reductase n=1 Tax=Halopseudomonas sp. Lyrl_26 TaxID=3110923 RepID=UPI003F7F6262